MPQKTAHACACAVYVYTHFTSQFTRYVNCNANSFIQHPSPHLSPIHGSSARMSHRQPTQVPEDPSMRPDPSCTDRPRSKPAALQRTAIQIPKIPSSEVMQICTTCSAFVSMNTIAGLNARIYGTIKAATASRVALSAVFIGGAFAIAEPA